MEIENKNSLNEAELAFFKFKDILSLLGSEDRREEQRVVLKGLEEKERKLAKRVFKSSNELVGSGDLVASCIVVMDKLGKEVEVVSFGIGTKSLSKDKIVKKENQLIDLHAEVLARKAFNSFLAGELISLSKDNPAYSEYFILGENGKLELKSGYELAILCTRMPCGDCSVFNFNQNPRIKLYSNACMYSDYKKSLSENSSRLPLENGSNLDFQIRIKPVRRDFNPKLIYPCLSCSDKIMLWSFLGLQGGCLSGFVNDLKLKKIFVPFIDEADIAPGTDRVKLEKLLREKITIALDFRQRVRRLNGWKSLDDLVREDQNQDLQDILSRSDYSSPSIGFFGLKKSRIIDKKSKKKLEVTAAGYFKNGRLAKIESINPKNGLKLGSNLKHIENKKSLSSFRSRAIKDKLEEDLHYTLKAPPNEYTIKKVFAKEVLSIQNK